MAENSNNYPLTKFHFQVDWGGGNTSFQEVTGLEMTREKAEYRGGRDPEFVKQQIPGMKTFGALTLKRGTFSGDNDFFIWWEGDPMPQKRNVTIILRDAKGDPVVTWIVRNAFPTKVTSTDLNATNNEVAVESIELAHEGIKIENKSA